MLSFDPSLLEPLAQAAGVPDAASQDPVGSSTGAGWYLFTKPGIYFALKWIHFLAGITWIGILYYFNFIQTPFFKGGAAKEVVSGMTRGLVPKALWYFRWGAMFTFISGWSMILFKAHDSAIQMPWDAPWMTKILTGGIMGTFMWFNVWFIIWPAQKIVIASAEKVAAGGEAIAEAAGRGAAAGLASRTNTLLSIPMLFFMGAAANLPSAPSNTMTYWIAAGALIALVEINALIGPKNLPTQKPLGSVSGTIHFGILLTAVFYVFLEVF